MLKCVSLYTLEVDSHEIAINDIKEQLESKITLLDNSVGIVMCNPEFIYSGVLKAVCENLPFDLAGVTTASQAVNDATDDIILTVFVMTSDDVRFSTGITEGLINGVDVPLRAAYEKAAAGISDKPKLALVFPPIMLHGGHTYIRAMEILAPNTPVFGTLSIDDTATLENSETIYNGDNYKSEMPFILCYGNIEPRFLIATASDSTAVTSKIPVTKASDIFVYEINNMNPFEYFTSLGLIERKGQAGIFQFFQVKVDMPDSKHDDGVPIIRELCYFQDDGTAVFYGDVEEGSTITILKCDVDDILSTTSHAIAQLNEMQNVNGALLFPCSVRRSVLQGVNKTQFELEKVKAEINPAIPFMMGYSGGEICPTSFKNGIPANRFHNYSMVILAV